MTDPADLPLWPDTVDAFYADRACSVRSAAARRSWGYTYRWLQRLYPGTPVGGFRTTPTPTSPTTRYAHTPGCGTSPSGSEQRPGAGVRSRSRSLNTSRSRADLLD